MQVFSQWKDALEIVSKALDVQRPCIQHVSLTGSKKGGKVGCFIFFTSHVTAFPWKQSLCEGST